ncbi:MAG TPA: archaemetzincin family Zn-dependent metalloprotease [Methanotrichaceae archaeon]|nr:archaemetzincin family Zn-dependent metalloprotease [Methanotrichaceae archaeon]HQF16191.1 archaemetzincin family Zn-dependent metalloprotease [Methanotrichaceae archaeon]HQI90927.1 archaemetzincin family Zn-dependent metalloprotease [Methanotrichaceae archaeon]HQJ28349.1 archaemetzincin family Zn-dependent metalloprotease [Methanotrichaceae archaeon]
MHISLDELYIQPLGRVDEEVLEFLRDGLCRLCKKADVKPARSMPRRPYNPDRGQYDGPMILEEMETDGGIVMGVTEMDLYATGLTFIFGMASRKKTLISLHRLRPEFYRAVPNMKLLQARAMKEAMHEIGHGLGLRHCPQISCVMHFSNSIVDTDLKDWRYCRRCSLSLARDGIDLPAEMAVQSQSIRIAEAVRHR